MVRFENRSSLDRDIFDSLLKTYISHSGLIVSDEGFSVIYTDAMPEHTETSGVYILRDNSLYNGGDISEEALSKTVILNSLAFDWDMHYSDSITLVYKKHNAYIIAFDIFGNLYHNIFTERNADNAVPYSEYLIDIFSDCLKSIAEDQKGGIAFMKSAPKGHEAYAMPTFDIDRLHYYHFGKTMYYAVKYIITGFREKAYFEARKKFGNKDPWNNLSMITDTLKNRGLKGLFFVMAVSRDRFGRRYSLKDAENILNTVKGNDTGIHLSYESHIEPERISKETARLRAGPFSRFHYIPDPAIEHYREMEKAGIRYDSSTGLRRGCGFAKGFSKPYYIPGTSIVEIPVVCMDSAVLTGDGKWRDRIEAADSAVRETGGFFTYIFHQSTLSGVLFEGYADIFNEFNDTICRDAYYNDNPSLMTDKFLERCSMAEWKNGELSVSDKCDYDVEIYPKKEI